MRPKVTFREGRMLRRKPQCLAWWEGNEVNPAHPPQYDKLDRDMREPVREHFRYLDAYLRRRTPAEDVTATLQALMKIDDDAKAQRAARRLDDWTQSELGTAANRMWRREHPDAAEVPDDLFDFATWAAKRMRETAREALRGNRRKYARGKTLGHWGLACLCITTWEKKGKKPTVTRTDGEGGDSEFLKWATKQFQAAGFKIKAGTVADILKKAKRG